MASDEPGREELDGAYAGEGLNYHEAHALSIRLLSILPLRGLLFRTQTLAAVSSSS